MRLPSTTAELRRAWRWLATRSPRTLLLAGWVVFGVCCYPGYMSFDSIAQLGEVRNGAFSETHAPLMSQLWAVCEYVWAGPAPMLAVQSGLFLFGGYLLLCRVLAPRAAALVAVGVLLAPPVYSVMAVLWADSLLAGALVAGAAALADRRPRIKLAGCAALVLACGCRLAIAPAVVPIAALTLPRWSRTRRFGAAVAIALACAATARLSTCMLVDMPGYATQSGVELLDVAGSARRARLHGADLDTAFAGLAVVDRAQLAAWIDAGHDTYDAWAVSHGAKNIVYPIFDDDEAAAVDAAWRRMVVDHPRAYLTHRWELFVRQLGFDERWDPVYDSLGDFNLLASVHHRATPSDVQLASRVVVRAVAGTPLFKPWLYLVLAVVALYFTRKRTELYALVASGVCYEVVQFVAADGVSYRASHWLIATVWIALVTCAVARKWPRRGPATSGPAAETG